MPIISPPPPSTCVPVSEPNIPAPPLDSVRASQSPPEIPRDINTNLPTPAPAAATPVNQAQDHPTIQTHTSPPSPVSNPNSALPSPIIVVPPTPEQPHEPQASTSTTASHAPPRPRASQSTFRHVGPSGMAGGRPYTHSPLRPTHRGTAPASPAATPGAGPTGTVFRALGPSTGSPPLASPAPGAVHTPSRTFTLSQQARTSSPLASSSIFTPATSGALPVIPIGQRGGTAIPASASSRLTSPAPTQPSTSPSSRSAEAPAAPQPPSKGPMPSLTPSTPQKTLPTVPQTQTTPPERPVSLPRHAGHTPTHSNTLPVHLPSSSAPISRSATPVSTPPQPQRASGSTPYRAGFQPKGVYRSHTDELLEFRARKRENGRVEQRRLERRLDKVCSIAILEWLLVDIIRGDTDLFLFLFLYIISVVLTMNSSSICTSQILRRPQAQMDTNPNQRSPQCHHLHDGLPVSLILIWAA